MRPNRLSGVCLFMSSPGTRVGKPVFACSWQLLRTRRFVAADCRSFALGAEGQGEALAVDRNGRALYTVPEGKRPAIRRYEPPGS